MARIVVLALLLLTALSGCVTAVRSDVSNIKQDSAVLKALVWGDRQERADFSVEYGTTQALGNIGGVVPVDLVAGQASPAQILVDDLQPATTYYWRACVHYLFHPNDRGCSDIGTFTTTALTEDIVYGGGGPRGGIQFFARSGASGENPSGYMVYGFDNFDVTCLNVQGKRASVGVRGSSSDPEVGGMLWTVEDSGDGTVDGRAYEALPAPLSTCPPPTAETNPDPLFNFDVRVVDAPG